MTDDPTWRQAPHNIEAEQALLGAMLIDGEAFERVSDFLEPAHFFDPLHRQIFDAAGQLIGEGKRVTPVTLKTYFETAQPINGAATVPAYLGRLAVNATTTANARDYGLIIHELATRRQLIVIGEDMVKAAYDPQIDFPSREQIEEVERRLFVLAGPGNGGAPHVDVTEITAAARADVERAYKNPGTLTGLSTGLKDLDDKTGGLQPSDLIIVAGATSMGKTSLATNIARTTMKVMVPVHFISLEMTPKQIGMRLLAEEASIPSEKLRTGQLSEDEWRRFYAAEKKLNELPLKVDGGMGGLTIAQLVTRARQVKRWQGTGLIVVDYLQLLSGTSKRIENRTAEVGEVSRGLKTLAKELNVPVVALSQLSRKVDDRPDHRPRLGDLRESGSIEQDADVVMFVFREEYYLKREMPSEEDTDNFLKWQTKFGAQFELVKGKADIIIGKQRHGPVCTVKLQFNEALTKFSSLTLSDQIFKR